eukprot:SAG31_NODE_29741_length_390_cov_1.247423_1_plen_26_part_10
MLCNKAPEAHEPHQSDETRQAGRVAP